MANVKISDIATTETDWANVAYIEGERGDASPVRVPASLISANSWDFDPPAASSFTLASGDATNLALTDDADAGLLIDCGAVVGGPIVRIAYIALTDKTLDWTMAARLRYLMRSSNFVGVGLVGRDSITGRTLNLGSHSNWPLAAISFNSLTSFNTNNFNDTLGDYSHLDWFRIRHTSGNYYFDVSPDGKNWVSVFNIGSTTWTTNRIDQVGFYTFYQSASGLKNVLSCPYFSLTGAGV